MGVVEQFEPKSLIEYEERALFVITIYALFLLDVPAARRVAYRLGDDELDRLLGLVAPPLLALEQAQALVEEEAVHLTRQILQYEEVTLAVRNLDQKWDVTFQATHRASMIYIKDIRIEERSWMSKLLAENPQVEIIRRHPK